MHCRVFWRSRLCTGRCNGEQEADPYTVAFSINAYGLGLDLANLTVTGLFVTQAISALAGGSLTDRFEPGPMLLAGFVGFTVIVEIIAAGVVPALAVGELFLLVGGIRSQEGRRETPLLSGSRATARSTRVSPS